MNYAGLLREIGCQVSHKGKVTDALGKKRRFRTLKAAYNGVMREVRIFCERK